MATLVKESERRTPARLAGSAILALQSDERLVKLAREGHERAFDAIVSRYRAALVRYCSRILPESRTEDAVQQAFINAHAALVAGDDPAQLKPWLYTITRNSALNMLRQNGWNYEQIPADFDGVRRPDQVVEQRIQLQTTVAAVSELPDRQRDAIVMREFEGRSYEEIALALGAGDGAVRQLLNRARGTLRAAASALMPPPVVERAASAMPRMDGRRLAEVLAGVGAGGAVKVGATALVAGSLVVGAVKAPLPLVGEHQAHRDKASLAPAGKSATANAIGTTSVADTAGADHGPANVAHGKAQSGHGHGSRGNSQHGSSRGESESRGRSREHGALAPGSRGEDRDRDHSGSGDEHHSTSGDDHSGSVSPTSRNGGDDHSGTSGSDDQLETSGGSGTSGSLSGDDSGSSGSGESGTSGSSDDSSTSGSGSSGSGESGTTTTTTSGSGISGSGESGSGISGSGSLDDH
jgi:RNA polymerase sigma factor (sigma-70 family)